jgi:hypothetical protein
MDRLVYYSILIPPAEPRPDLLRQFELSVMSLRRFNRSIPVVLFVYGNPAPELFEICGTHRVMVQLEGSYEERLAAWSPQGWRALATYPLLHRFLHFERFDAADPQQLLYVDCDTVFFDDVDRLFADYGGFAVVAREEVHSRRSHYGYDRSFIDEGLLGDLATGLGVTPIRPFNLGVMLFNDRSWRLLVDLVGQLLDYAWRFVGWMVEHPANPHSGYGEFRGVDVARATMQAADRSRVLPFPSVNRWILDEVSFWLTLGHVPGIATADFSPSDVAQNGELFHLRPNEHSAVLCHYFSNNLDRVEAWLSQFEIAAVGAP